MNPSGETATRAMLAKMEVEPLLIDARAAAAACGVSRSTFLGWDAAGLCPRPVRMVGRVLWVVADLRRWTNSGCPSREQFEQLNRVGDLR
jgi:predicted DNA-binding transcriptional regulator AlpA